MPLGSSVPVPPLPPHTRGRLPTPHWLGPAHPSTPVCTGPTSTQVAQSSTTSLYPRIRGADNLPELKTMWSTPLPPHTRG